MSEQFKPLENRAKTAILALYGLWFTTSLAIAILVHEIASLHRMPAEQLVPAATSYPQQPISPFQIIILLLAILAFMPWIWRATLNLRALGAPGPAPSLRQATLGWLVPILNLLYAHRTIMQLWHGSQPAAGAVPKTIMVWWTSWAVSTTLHLIVYLATPARTTVYGRGDMLQLDYALLAANLTALVSIAAMIRLISMITFNQHAKKLGSAPKEEESPSARAIGGNE